MKRVIKSTFVLAAVVLLGVVAVHAATQTVLNIKNYSLSGGGTNTYNLNTARYKYAYAGMEPTSINGGSDASTIVKVSLLVGGLATNTVSKTFKISTSYSRYGEVGEVGAGTWTIVNTANTGTSSLPGWKGTFTVNSLSSPL